MLLDFSIIRGVLFDFGLVGLNGGHQVTQLARLIEHAVAELFEGLDLLNVGLGFRVFWALGLL